MLDPKTLFSTNVELIDAEHLQGLNLVMGFTGYADAGQAVGQFSSELLEQLQSEPVAVFDVDQLIDYRSRRPVVNFVEDHLEDYQRPQLVAVKPGLRNAGAFGFGTPRYQDIGFEKPGASGPDRNKKK